MEQSFRGQKDEKHQDKWSNYFTRRQSNSSSEAGLKEERVSTGPKKI